MNWLSVKGEHDISLHPTFSLFATACSQQVVAQAMLFKMYSNEWRSQQLLVKPHWCWGNENELPAAHNCCLIHTDGQEYLAVVQTEWLYDLYCLIVSNDTFSPNFIAIRKTVPKFTQDVCITPTGVWAMSSNYKKEQLSLLENWKNVAWNLHPKNQPDCRTCFVISDFNKWLTGFLDDGKDHGGDQSSSDRQSHVGEGLQVLGELKQNVHVVLGPEMIIGSREVISGSSKQMVLIPISKCKPGTWKLV